MNAVLLLMRKAQKESYRLRNFKNSDAHKTARYWEGIVDSYLEAAKEAEKTA
jgi:hypothetical protein